jgi:hypothetical protein
LNLKAEKIVKECRSSGKKIVVLLPDSYAKKNTQNSEGQSNAWLYLRLFCFLVKLHWKKEFFIFGREIDWVPELMRIDRELNESWKAFPFCALAHDIPTNVDAWKDFHDEFENAYWKIYPSYDKFLLSTDPTRLLPLNQLFSSYNLSCYCMKYFWLQRSCISTFYCRSVNTQNHRVGCFELQLLDPCTANGYFPSGLVLSRVPLKANYQKFFSAFQSLLHDLVNSKAPKVCAQFLEDDDDISSQLICIKQSSVTEEDEESFSKERVQKKKRATSQIAEEKEEANVKKQHISTNSSCQPLTPQDHIHMVLAVNQQNLPSRELIMDVLALKKWVYLKKNPSLVSPYVNSDRNCGDIQVQWNCREQKGVALMVAEKISIPLKDHEAATNFVFERINSNLYTFMFNPLIE